MPPRILGPDGQPIRTDDLKTRVAVPSSTGVRQVQSGNPAQGLTPERLASILRNAENGYSQAYLELAEVMEEKYLHYLSQLSTRKRALCGLDIEVEPADDSAQALAHADYLKLTLPAIKASLFDMQDAVGKGFSLSEILWDTSEKQWMPTGLEWVDPRWTQFSRLDGRTLMLRDAYQPDGLPLAPYKFVQHRVAAKSGLPIRGGLARAAAWAYLFTNYGLKDWVVFLEVFGHPLRLGKYDPLANDEDVEILLNAVRDIGSDAAAVIPNSMDIAFPTANGGKGTSDLWERLLEYLDRQISKAVLGQTLTSDTGKGGGGSYALGGVHNEVRRDILHADVQAMESTLARDWAKPAVDLNFGIQKAYPRIKIVVEEPEDLAALADNLTKIVPLGVQVPVRWVHDKFNIPRPAEGEEVLTPQAAATLAGKDGGTSNADPAQPAPASHQRSAHAATAGTQAEADDGIDALRDLALADWQPLMRPVMHPLVAALDQSLAQDETLEQFRQRLAGLVGQMDGSALADSLANAQFLARLVGETGELGLPTDPAQDQAQGPA
jgi:phage gp29-like protein